MARVKLGALAAILLLTAHVSAQTSAPELLREARQILQESVSAFDDERILESADLFRRALEQNPRYAQAEIGLAEALLWLEDYDGASRALDRAAELRYTGLDASLLRARLAVLSGDVEQAIEIYDRLAIAQPYNPDIVVAQAVLSLTAGVSVTVTRRLESLERRYPQNLQLLVALIEIHRREGNDDAARRYIDLALRYHNDNAVVQLSAARYALASDEVEQAVFFAQNAVQIAPQYSDAWLVLAQATADSGNHAEALQHYETLITLDPENHRAWYARSILLYRQGDDESAIAGLERARGIRPDYEIARIALEHIVHDSTPLEDSERETLAAYYLGTGRSLEDRFLHRRAERVYRRGLYLNPFDPDLRIALAELFLFRDLRSRYLQELEVLASLGFDGYQISDRIESYRALLRDSISSQWEVDQFTAQRPRTRVALFVRQDGQTVEPDAALNVGRYLSTLVNSSQNVVVTTIQEWDDGRAQTLSAARGSGADRLYLVDLALRDRRTVLSVELIDTSSADSLLTRVIPYSGLERLDRAVRDAASLLVGSAPVRGTVLDRRQDRIVVSIGSVDGVSIDDRVELRAARSDVVLGEARVVATDDLLSELVYTAIGADVLSRGDIAVYMGPPPEETESEDDTDSESVVPNRPPSTLPLVRSLFLVSD